MNRKDYELANMAARLYTPKDWTLFLESCRKYARERQRPNDAEDFAQFASIHKLQHFWFKYEHAFTDYLRSTYGDTRSIKHRERIKLECATPQDFDYGSVRDDSEFSRPDILCERKLEDEFEINVVNSRIYDLSFDDVFIYMLRYRLDYKGSEISYLLDVTPARISQICSRIKKIISNE